jgi:hypothetical protein
VVETDTVVDAALAQDEASTALLQSFKTDLILKIGFKDSVRAREEQGV